MESGPVRSLDVMVSKSWFEREKTDIYFDGTHKSFFWQNAFIRSISK